MSTLKSVLFVDPLFSLPKIESCSKRSFAARFNPGSFDNDPILLATGSEQSCEIQWHGHDSPLGEVQFLSSFAGNIPLRYFSMVVPPTL